MSEQFHQHLNNLTLWEQIDRLFNPNKYSCTYNYTRTDITSLLIILITTLIITIILIKIIQKTIEKEEKQNDLSNIHPATNYFTFTNRSWLTT